MTGVSSISHRVPIALVGLGDIGVTAHLPALQRNPDVHVAALVDPVASRRDAVAGLAPTFGSVEEVPDDVRAIVLATPPWVTTSLAASQLRAGRFVLAEKPIATSVAAAEPLLHAPTDRLQVGLTYRHDPALEALRSWIAEQPGPLLIRAHIYDERRDPADGELMERIRADLEHGPPVMHEGSHVFDWLTFLLGSGPDAIEDAWALRTGDLVNLGGARLSYPGGHVALVEFGWWTAELPRCELSVLADSGYALLDGFSFDLRLSGELVRFPGERMARCFDRQLERFVELVRGGRAVPGFSDGLTALQISESVAAAAAGARS
ncbi:MAG TPA: Gfo/Idh/MocA family oxidoreductase [Mycobacteriales bacterium]|nr:Gfo/Idh/MocA family oxidoreductase [Mycobacteriales bacterium]